MKIINLFFFCETSKIGLVNKMTPEVTFWITFSEKQPFQRRGSKIGLGILLRPFSSEPRSEGKTFSTNLKIHLYKHLTFFF